MRVRYTRRAQNDLAKIFDYLDERSPQGARNVKQSIKRTIDTIADQPGLGHATGTGAMRGIPVSSYPYLIYWTVEFDDVWIIHIRHAARRSWRLNQLK